MLVLFCGTKAAAPCANVNRCVEIILGHPVARLTLDAKTQMLLPNLFQLSTHTRNLVYVLSLFNDAGTRMPAPVIPPS